MRNMPDLQNQEPISVLSHLQNFREMMVLLRVSPNPEVFLPIVIERCPTSLKQSLQAYRRAGKFSTEQDLMDAIKQLTIGASSLQNETSRAVKELEQKFAAQSRGEFDANKCVLYCTGTIADRLLAARPDNAQLNQSQRALIREEMAKSIFNDYIKLHFPDAMAYLRLNQWTEDPLLKQASKINSFLKNPLSGYTVGNTNLGGYVPPQGPPTQQDPAASIEAQVKFRELQEDNEKMKKQNIELRKQLKKGAPLKKCPVPGYVALKDIKAACEPCRAHGFSMEQCLNRSGQVPGAPQRHCWSCSNQKKQNPVWPCPEHSSSLNPTLLQFLQSRGPPRSGTFRRAHPTGP
jgi:hypothetical protein